MLRKSDKSASFHGRLPEDAAARTMRRPRTHPDLLGGGSATPASIWRVPSKVLVNVTVQRSLGAVQVVASTDWSVSRLVDAAIRQYVKEGRRPLLPSTDPDLFGLHYSQFSLERIDGEEKLIALGSRSFFLCPQPAPAGNCSSCSQEAKGGGGGGKSSSAILSWLTLGNHRL